MYLDIQNLRHEINDVFSQARFKSPIGANNSNLIAKNVVILLDITGVKSKKRVRRYLPYYGNYLLQDEFNNIWYEFLER